MKFGWKPDREDIRDRVLRQSQEPGSLPLECDQSSLRPRILDQRNLGSCTAQAGITVLEAVHYRQTGKRKEYSRLFNYYTTRVFFEYVSPWDDSGAQNRNVMKSLARFGVCEESLWPYDLERFAEDPGQEAFLAAEQKQAILYYRIPDLFTLKASLTHGFLCTLGFSVPQNFLSAACALTGILHYPEPGETFDGGHAVTVVGYRDNKMIDGVPGALLCANSWGKAWGLDGLFWMPYRFFEDGFANRPLARDCWTLRLVEA